MISYDHRPVSQVELADNVLETFVGKYQMSPDRFITVSRNGKLLVVKDGDWSANLHSESSTKFYLDYENVQFEFQKGRSGKVEKLLIYDKGVVVEQGRRIF